MCVCVERGNGGGYQTWSGEGGAMPGWQTGAGPEKRSLRTLLRLSAPTHLRTLQRLIFLAMASGESRRLMREPSFSADLLI